MVDYSVEVIVCFAVIFIILIFFIFYIFMNRDQIIYLFKYGRFKPKQQGRVCPGCRSDELTILQNGSVRCNVCSALFASTKQLVAKKNEK